MRFLDANVIVYAILKTRRKLNKAEMDIKKSAKSILSRVDSKEKVLTTVVHLSEVMNILEGFMDVRDLADVLLPLLTHGNIEIVSTSREHYILACDMAEEYDIGINDALACIVMQMRNIVEIYSFDRHFDKVEDIERIVH